MCAVNNTCMRSPWAWVNSTTKMAAPMETANEARVQVSVSRQINELRVLQSELSSLEKNAKVYKQQQNSHVFFLTDKGQCQSECTSQIEMLEKMKKTKELQ